MQEHPPPPSEYKIQRNPYDIDSDKSDAEEDAPRPALSALSALLQQLRLSTIYTC